MSHSTHTGRAVSRRDFLKTASVAGAAAMTGGLLSAHAADAAKTKPNVLLVITDQQHLDTMAAAGCKHAVTPGMDRLVKRGVTFTQSHSTNPVCSPARSSIFTGRATCETGVYRNNLPIVEAVPNLGQWLSEKAGYETFYVGKWHMPRSFTYEIPGFNVLYAGINGQGNLMDGIVAQTGESFLHTRRGAKPFFLVASFMQPHDICEWLRLNRDARTGLPYPELEDELPPLPDNFDYDKREPRILKHGRPRLDPYEKEGPWDESRWRYYRWSYYRHIEMVDAEIDRLLGALEDSGHAGNTLVIFTSDHGEGLGHHRMVRKNFLYDEAVRVPFVMALPGRLPEGKIDREHLVSGCDIAPTVCDYAGVDPPPDVRGRSLRGVAEGKNAEGNPFVVSEVRRDKGRMIRTGRFKYVAFRGDDTDQLFDMTADPGETKNLAAEARYADEVKAHRKLLMEWESRLKPIAKLTPWRF